MDYKNIENALLQGATLCLWDMGRCRTRKNPKKFQPAVGVTYKDKHIGYGNGDTITQALHMCNDILCIDGNGVSVSDEVVVRYERKSVVEEDFESDLASWIRSEDGMLNAKSIDGIIICSISGELVLDVERGIKKTSTGNSLSSAIHSALKAKYVITH